MRRRGFLTAVVLGAVGLSGCSLLPGGSADSAAVAARLKAWLEKDPRVASVGEVGDSDIEGDVRGFAKVTLVAPVTSAVLSDFMAAFFAASGSDHWDVSIVAVPGLRLDSRYDNAKVRALPGLWARVAVEPSLTDGDVRVDVDGLGFSIEVSDDAVAHGLRLVGADWVSPLGGYHVNGPDVTRSVDYHAGTADPADIDALQRFAAAYRGALVVNMRGTEQGELLLRPAADQLDVVKHLVASSDLPSSFKVTYLAPVVTPTSSRT